MWHTHVCWLKPDAKDIDLNQDEFLLKHDPLAVVAKVILIFQNLTI